MMNNDPTSINHEPILVDVNPKPANTKLTTTSVEKGILKNSAPSKAPLVTHFLPNQPNPVPPYSSSLPLSQSLPKSISCSSENVSSRFGGWNVSATCFTPATPSMMQATSSCEEATRSRNCQLGPAGVVTTCGYSGECPIGASHLINTNSEHYARENIAIGMNTMNSLFV